jgi:perosamine synthetase
MYSVPFLRPPFSDAEINAVTKVMRGSNISTGAERAIFEDMFRDYVGVPYAMSVANGTIALELVWETLIRNGKLKKGDKVLLPSFTFVACANSVVQSGLVPVFCDIDKEMWNGIYQWDNVDISAILAVHTFGNPCNCDEILYLKEKGLIVVEDCAESCGASYNGRMCGSFGDASIFSFNATKNMTTGEGGMVCMQDKEDADTALLLAENGYGYTSRNALIPGHNYRLSNIQCAIGIEQLLSLDTRNIKRRANAGKLMIALNSENIKCLWQDFDYKNSRPVYQIFGITLPYEHNVDHNLDGRYRDIILNHLIRNGIEAKKYFSPHISEQDYYAKNYIHPNYPNTDYVSNHIICLPFDDKISDAEVQFMVEKLAEVV